jgi:hypothetical protein
MTDMHRNNANYAENQLSCWLWDIKVSQLPTVFLPKELDGGGLTDVGSPQEQEAELEE